jgi:hypothetical protein
MTRSNSTSWINSAVRARKSQFLRDFFRLELANKPVDKIGTVHCD